MRNRWTILAIALALTGPLVATVPFASQAEAAAPASIMFIGDSLTAGLCNGNTYAQATFRDDTLNALLATYDVTALGSRQGPAGGCFQAVDDDHESYPGFEADVIANQLATSLPGQAEPDVSFILAGINDIYGGGETPAKVEADIQLIINRILAHAPNTNIVLAQIPFSGGASSVVEDLNNRIALLATNNGYALADFNTGIGPAQQVDGLHFNDAGAAIVGARAAAAIVAAGDLLPREDDTAPPVVTFPNPVVTTASPMTISGTIADTGSGVDRLEIIAVDLGAAGATGVADLRWWDGTSWGPDRTTLTATLNGSDWSFTWDPVPGGSGSYAIGLVAYDNAGNKWPANKDLQAIVVVSDTTPPTLSSFAPEIEGRTITWSGSALEDVAVRKVRMIIRHVETNEYWNGSQWITSAAAATDSSILLHAQLSDPLDPKPSWTYELQTVRTGQFQTLHWAQNGAFKYSSPVPDAVTR